MLSLLCNYKTINSTIYQPGDFLLSKITVRSIGLEVLFRIAITEAKPGLPQTSTMESFATIVVKPS